MFILFSLFHACHTTEKTTSHSPNDENDMVEPAAAPDLQWEEAFKISERPYALTADSEQQIIYCNGQSGENIYTWNNTGSPSRLTGQFSDSHGLFFAEDGLYYTTSDHGVTGSLEHYQDGASTELAVQADNGTLFRWPMDLQQSSTNEWILADYNEAALFVFSSAGTFRIDAGSSFPETLAWLDNNLYIGGEDGIWKMEWPQGNPEQVDDRAAYGLVAVNNEIWAVNSTDGIFAIGGNAAPIEDIARPGKMLHFENMLYVADHAGQYVWVATTLEE